MPPPTQRTYLVTVREMNYEPAAKSSGSGDPLYAEDDETNPKDNWPLPVCLMHPPERVG
jgi:hypothetical protein